jgi:hypothetical protein
MNGYLHKAYAGSLSDNGEIIFLPHSIGWILKRKVPNFNYYDGMGIYPLFICENWDGLTKDLKEIRTELICFSIVTDPFGSFDKRSLEKEFTDIFFPFKEHFVINLSEPYEKMISKHHWRNIRKAQDEIFVEMCESPKLVANEWIKLYKHLIKIHQIRGIPAFSEKALTVQLEVPGVKVFRGIHDEETVGMLIWYVHNNIGYYHLGASNKQGYRLKASFALFWESIKYFSSIGLSWINLGAGAGTKNNKTSGLTRFKKGWSSDTRTAYFCGKIFDHDLYHKIKQSNNVPNTNYFPAYRSSEIK